MVLAVAGLIVTTGLFALPLVAAVPGVPRLLGPGSTLTAGDILTWGLFVFGVVAGLRTMTLRYPPAVAWEVAAVVAVVAWFFSGHRRYPYSQPQFLSDWAFAAGFDPPHVLLVIGIATLAAAGILLLPRQRPARTAISLIVLLLLGVRAVLPLQRWSTRPGHVRAGRGHRPEPAAKPVGREEPVTEQPEPAVQLLGFQEPVHPRINHRGHAPKSKDQPPKDPDPRPTKGPAAAIAAPAPTTFTSSTAAGSTAGAVDRRCQARRRETPGRPRSCSASPCRNRPASRSRWTTRPSPSPPAAEDDYYPAKGTLIIPPGRIRAGFVVNVVGDIKIEPDEVFLVELSNPINAVIRKGSGTGTIVNDDGDPPAPPPPPPEPPAIEINDVTVREGDSGTTPATFRLALSRPSDKAVTGRRPDRRRGPPPRARTSVLIEDHGDVPPGPDHRHPHRPGDRGHQGRARRGVHGPAVQPGLSATVQTVRRGSASSWNDDQVEVPPDLTIEDVKAREGNEGKTPFRFAVQLSHATDKPVSVDYTTAAKGTAVRPPGRTSSRRPAGSRSRPGT